MPRRFNTAGPNDPADHHTLPVLARLPDVRRMIDEKLYFVLHAPRQAGKTTALLTLARELTSEERYVAVVLSLESGAPFGKQLGMAEDAILDAWQGAASRRLPAEMRPPEWPSAPPGRRISRALQAWAEAAPRPLVVLLDDVDALEDVVLVSVLRQLRDGFSDRPRCFPWSVVLSGMRDAPDYKLTSGPGGRSAPENPFNIRSDSLTLRDFSREGIAALYARHTEETGQVFLPVAVDRAFRLSRGQPWLVNALAQKAVEVLVRDRALPIGASHIDDARGLLVRGQSAHFTHLAEQLHEPRLRALLEPMLRGQPLGDVDEEDRRLALDLGLVRSAADGALAIANPMYREVLVRILASKPRPAPARLSATWVPAEEVLGEESAPAEPEQFLEMAPTRAAIAPPAPAPTAWTSTLIGQMPEAPARNTTLLGHASPAPAPTPAPAPAPVRTSTLMGHAPPVAARASVMGERAPSPAPAPARMSLAAQMAPAAVMALARTSRLSLESYPPEELTEWFRPVVKVHAHAVGAPPPRPSTPRVSRDSGEAAIDRRLRRRAVLRRGVAIAGAACALVATVAWVALSGESPASATPSEGTSSVASMPAPPAQPAATPQSTAAPGVAPFAVALGSAGPAAAAREASVRAPTRAPAASAVVTDPRPRSRVVPALPALPAPDQEKIRRELEPKVWGGEASTEEIRMLKAICSNAGDHGCRDRAAEMLKRREP